MAATDAREWAAMTDGNRLSYTALELSGSLPSGWILPEPVESAMWNSKKNTWTIRVADPAGVDWDLVVKAEDVGKIGRLEALRESIERLWRHCLG